MSMVSPVSDTKTCCGFDCSIGDKQSTQSNDAKQRALKDMLVILNAAAESVGDAVAFEKHMIPEMRVVLACAQWTMFMNTLKSASKAAVQTSLQNIDAPSRELMTESDKAIANINRVAGLFSESMLDITNLMQNQLRPGSVPAPAPPAAATVNAATGGYPQRMPLM